MKKRKIFITILAFIAIIYFGGVYVFSNYTYPNTKVNGVEVPLKKIHEVFETSRFQDIKIEDKDGNEYTLNPKKLGFKSNWEKEIVVDQQEFLWPIQIFKSHTYNNKLIREVNTENLNKWIYSSDLIKKQVNPVDANIVFEDGNYVLNKEIEGNKLNIEKLTKGIEDAFLSFEDSLKLDKDYYIFPEIYEDDLKEKYNSLSKLADKNITLVLQDGKEEPITDYEKFVDEKTYEVSKDKVKDFVMELKSKYDNLRAERDFTTFSGNKIKVSGGNFGVQINRDKTTDAIYNSLTNDADNKIPIVYSSEAINNGEIGNTYIEISIADQRMIYYKNGEVIADTPIVTGLPNGRYNTPRGVWKVWIKNQDRYLRGLNADGSKYESWVNYWMQIDYTGVGIHDAYWQSSFGGKRYLWAGSHGCINTPLKSMRTIYENTEMGTPVIVY
ncbi:L,D-transpeptidase family protein [Mediannikoviicoccus vaginalis]|uniref:L,D-transpeptidase family protein n=1 Tax=Mediannikoviicoccus vaginalis TaxID=2899727 RepID=UPI001EFFE16C|nr:L,D-transpeptidase family protein [Mediannikoviicoccus vaginalis]